VRRTDPVSLMEQRLRKLERTRGWWWSLACGISARSTHPAHENTVTLCLLHYYRLGGTRVR
jgi:hypothetical protein